MILNAGGVRNSHGWELMQASAQDEHSPSDQQSAQPRLWLSALLCGLLLAMEIYVLVYDLGTGSRGSRAARPVVATFRQGQNEVRNKPAGTITWSVPTPGDELHREDTILTMKNAQATVQFTDGAEMNIEPESLVVLEKTPAENSDRYQKIVIKLVQGSLTKKSNGSLPIAIDVGASGKAHIEDITGKALFRLNASADGYDLSVESGTLRLGDEKNGQVVTESQRATILNDGKIEVREVKVRFFDLTPDLGKRVSRQSHGEKIALAWAQSGSDPKAKVRALVSRTSDLTQAEEADLEDSGDQRRHATFETKRDGVYFWRLESEDKSVQSSTASFTVVTRAPPEVESPQNDFEAIVNQPVLFRWSPVENNPTIVLETSVSEDFKTPISQKARPGESGIEARYANAQTIYWRIRADYGPEIGLSPPSESRKLVVKPKPLLQAPKIYKPKIRIQTSEVIPWIRSAIMKLADWLWVRSAMADEMIEPKPRNIIVDLEWDEVEGADQYHIQIASDEEFKQVLSDRKTRTTAFGYKTKQLAKARTLYFRVASVDATGTEGPFSENHEIEIGPLPKPKRPKKPNPANPLAAVPEEDVIKDPTPEELQSRGRFRVDVSIGAAFHSRKLTNSTTKPTQALGGAMIPAFGSFELRRALGDNPWDKVPARKPGSDRIPEPKGTHPTAQYIADPDDPDNVPLTLNIGASMLAEQAEPTTQNVIVEKYPLPFMRAWVMLEKLLSWSPAGAGVYGATSAKFSWNGRHAVAERKILLGVSGELMSSPLVARNWHMRGQLGLVGVGGIGADVALQLRRTILSGGPVRLIDHRGFFVEAEVLGRFMNVETSFGGVFKIGYSF